MSEDRLVEQILPVGRQIPACACGLRPIAYARGAPITTRSPISVAAEERAAADRDRCGQGPAPGQTRTPDRSQARALPPRALPICSRRLRLGDQNSRWSTPVRRRSQRHCLRARCRAYRREASGGMIECRRPRRKRAIEIETVIARAGLIHRRHLHSVKAGMAISWPIGMRGFRRLGDQGAQTGDDLMSQTPVLKVCRHAISRLRSRERVSLDAESHDDRLSRRAFAT